MGKIQYSTFNGGALNGQSQTWYSLGLNLAYTFNPHVSAEIGYNYDDLTSAMCRRRDMTAIAFIWVSRALIKLKALREMFLNV